MPDPIPVTVLNPLPDDLEVGHLLIARVLKNVTNGVTCSGNGWKTITFFTENA